MPGHAPLLDDQALARLRDHVSSLQHDLGGVLPLRQLVNLASDVRTHAGVTLDLQATERLGAPLVVLRVPERADEPLAGLTPREAQVCGLIAAGRSNKQIAARLHLALATVKDHVHNVLRKTGLPNRAAIAARSALNARGQPAEG